MPEEADIRVCAEEDLAEVAALYQRWQEEESVYGLRAEPAERLRQRMGDFFLVARADGKAVGFAIGSPGREPFCIFPDGRPYLEVEDVYVAPDFRGRGIGTALVKSLMDAATEKGISRFSLYSASRRYQEAVRFYERFGFEVWAIQMFKR